MDKSDRAAYCTWTESDSDYDDHWETLCDNAFTLLDGTPKENDMVYCPYCGRKIQEVVIAVADDEDEE